jgi:hypothetical protein
MASEKRGILYEAIVYLCLEVIQAETLPGRTIFWNQTPEDMRIDSDITIGEDANNPTHLLLISHSTAEHNSDMKFWRNMGEVDQARTFLSPPPVTVGILFDAKFKRNLLLLQPYAFDDFIIVEHEPYGTIILDFAREHARHLPKDRAEKLSYIKKYASSDLTLGRALKQLQDRIAIALAAKNPQAEHLWRAVKTGLERRCKPRIPTARNTSLRRGVAKLLLFDSIPSKTQVVPEVFIDLGLARKSLRGPLLIDSDIIGVLDLLATEQLGKLHQHYSSMEEFSILVKPLQSLPAFDPMWEYVVENWPRLLRSEELLASMIRTHADPYGALGLNPQEVRYLVPGWLVITLITLLKAHSGKRMDFGYSKIVEDIDKIPLEQRDRFAQEVLGRAGLTVDAPVRSSRTIEYGLRDFLYGEARTNFNIYRSELAIIAFVLSQRLAEQVGSTAPRGVGRQARDFFVADTIETKLLSHPSFQPIKLLITNELQKRRMKFTDIPYFPSPLRGLAVADGIKVNIRAGSTNVLRVNSTLIRWISVSDAGKVHKTKEFCGRAWGFRACVNEITGYVAPSDWLRKTILAVDGTFTADDLSLLIRCGWDEIYYPDEMDKLAAAIV